MIIIRPLSEKNPALIMRQKHTDFLRYSHELEKTIQLSLYSDFTLCFNHRSPALLRQPRHRPYSGTLGRGHGLFPLVPGCPASPDYRLCALLSLDSGRELFRAAPCGLSDTLAARTAPPREARQSAFLPGTRRAPHLSFGATGSHPVALSPHFGAQQQRATCKFKRPLAHDQGTEPCNLKLLSGCPE